MNTPEPTAPVRITARGRLLPLYAAGFVTAFGAHSIAASLGGYTHAQHASLLTLGCCWPSTTAPRSRSNRCSGHWPTALAPARCCWVVCSRSPPPPPRSCSRATRPGSGWPGSGRAPPRPRSPRRPGCWSRGLPQIPGRAAGSAATAPGKAWATPWARSWAACSSPPAAILCCSPPWRCSALSSPAGLCWWCLLRRRCRGPGRPWPILSADSPAPASCGRPWRWPPPPPPCRSGWGSCPWSAPARGLGPLATGAIVSLLAAAAALIQPRAGRARDRGRIGDRTGLAAGLALTAIGCAAVLIPGIAGLVLAALLIGCGVGVITPIGFAHLAATTPTERLGQTLGAAEVGRELGDAGGPLLVGALAAAATLTPALLIFAALLTATAAIVAVPSEATRSSNRRGLGRLIEPWMGCRQRDDRKEQHDDRGPIAGRVRSSATRPGALRLPRGRRICAAGRLRRPAARGDHPDRGGHLRRFGSHEHRRRVSSSRSSPPSSATTSVSSSATSADARWCTATAATSS